MRPRVDRDRLPAVLVESPVAEELVVLLGVLRGSVRGVVERVGHADPVDTPSGRGTVELRFWNSRARHVQDGGRDVGDVVVLLADLAARRDALRPMTPPGRPGCHPRCTICLKYWKGVLPASAQPAWKCG